mgnify:FL=1
MRHLLTAIVVVILVSIGWVNLDDKFDNQRTEVQLDDTLAEDEVMVEPDESSENNSYEEHVYYYGDTLAQYDGKTVDIDYVDYDSDLSSLSSSQIVTYVDTTLVSRSRVIGNGMYYVDGSTLKFAIGVDTVMYDMRWLPKILNPGKAFLQANVVEHIFVRSFALSDSSWNCDFKFLAYLPFCRRI